MQSTDVSEDTVIPVTVYTICGCLVTLHLEDAEMFLLSSLFDTV